MPARCHGFIVDAEKPLPFGTAMFDLALIVDFVSDGLISRIAQHIKPGGLLIYQTMSARGENWRQLPRPGATLEKVSKDFELLDYATRPAGPHNTEAESIALVGRCR